MERDVRGPTLDARAEPAAAHAPVGDPIRVAYTVEQCWHETPGGTAVAALCIARELLHRGDEVDLALVAGKHLTRPDPPFRPPASVAMLPLSRPWLYEAWTRARWPKVESVTGEIDVAHATGLIPCATAAPLVVTVHDLAFVHSPEMFTRHGARLMRRSLAVIGRRADRVICSSQATLDDCVDAGLDPARLRLVPLGVDVVPATIAEVESARTSFDLEGDFVLFVGTLEPRKNLRRLAAAMRIVGREVGGDGLPLVVAGAPGWGDVEVPTDVDVRFVGFVDDAQLRGLYAAATVFAYPSEREGFGLPVAEAMAQGTAVVTSSGTSTEEVAGGAAVLVDPFDVESIADGILRALRELGSWGPAGRARADQLTWGRAADATLSVYREVCA